MHPMTRRTSDDYAKQSPFVVAQGHIQKGQDKITRTRQPPDEHTTTFNDKTSTLDKAERKLDSSTRWLHKAVPKFD